MKYLFLIDLLIYFFSIFHYKLIVELIVQAYQIHWDHPLIPTLNRSFSYFVNNFQRYNLSLTKTELHCEIVTVIIQQGT